MHIFWKNLNTLKGDEEIESQQLPVSGDPTISSYIVKFHRPFKGISKCEEVITLHINDHPKPFIQPQRPIPFHLRKKCDSSYDEMMRQGIFEEPTGVNAWISKPSDCP